MNGFPNAYNIAQPAEKYHPLNTKKQEVTQMKRWKAVGMADKNMIQTVWSAVKREIEKSMQIREIHRGSMHTAWVVPLPYNMLICVQIQQKNKRIRLLMSKVTKVKMLKETQKPI